MNRMMEVMKDERIDDLQLRGLKIIQKRKGFCFGVDAVLLSDFVDVKQGHRVIDLGTGNGIIPILLAGKTKAERIIGVELQEHLVEMAVRSVRMNGLENTLQILHADIKEVLQHFLPSSFDVVVSNPPYMKVFSGLQNEDLSVALARHEIRITLEEVVGMAANLLKQGGQFAIVHKPERLVDILCQMRHCGIEPKEIRFVHPSTRKKANIVLIKGTKGGKPALQMLPPLFVFEDTGKFSKEIDRIYGRGGIQHD
jgi:tRNA1(Val) A37 N6-methylase TrmN6